MKKISKIANLTMVFVLMAFCLCACSRREVHTIEANQTAFLIPLKGNTANQASFESEELLNEAKVAAKQVSITYTREKVGPMEHQWIADNMLIIVDRTPVTREWSDTANIGTSTSNQAIYAESKESIGFSVGMNCSAQIYTEQDAVKFLYSYNNKSLADIMDSEIRARVESDFVEICAKYTMAEILTEKQAIMDYVRNDVTSYFADRGITITVLGMKDGIQYDDPSVQSAINAAFVANRESEAQAVKNQTKIDAAKADADAMLIKANAEAEANKVMSESITEELLKKQMYEKWDGKLPTISGGAGTPIINVDEIMK